MVRRGTLSPHARGLEGEQEAAPVPEEELLVRDRDLHLIGLGDVRIEPVHGRDEPEIELRVARVREDRGQVRVSAGEREEPNEAPGALLDRIDASGRRHEVRNVRGRGAGGRAQVEPSLTGTRIGPSHRFRIAAASLLRVGIHRRMVRPSAALRGSP